MIFSDDEKLAYFENEIAEAKTVYARWRTENLDPGRLFWTVANRQLAFLESIADDYRRKIAAVPRDEP